MPNSNQIDVNVSIDTPQADVAALAKLTEALKNIPGAQGGGGGRIQGQFGTTAEVGLFLAQQKKAAEDINLKLSGASVRATAGGLEASARVDEGQKKAFSPGGLVASIGTGVGAIAAGFKQVLGMSKIFQTFMATTGKILGAAIDLMLAPLMPFIVRIMVWLIHTVFPIAQKVTGFMDKFGGAGTAVGLVGGYVALKFGTTLLEKAGASLGVALVNKMPYDTFGKNLSAGLSLAAKTLVSWGGTVGSYVVDGVNAGRKSLLTLGASIGHAITAAFLASRAAMVRLGAAIGIGQAGGFIGMKATMVLIGRGIGVAMGLGFQGMRAAFIFLGTAIGVAMGYGFTGSNIAMTALATKLGVAMSGGFLGARLALLGVGSAIGGRISLAFLGARIGMLGVGSAIGGKIGTAFGASSALRTAATFVGGAIAGAIRMAPAWVAIGGIVGAALGAATIGAAIGYAMWRSYKAHEEGRNLFAGKNVNETYTMLREVYGIAPNSAVDLSQAVAGVGSTGPWKDQISVSEDAFHDFLSAWRQIQELALTKAPMTMFQGAFERLDRPEAEFILNQLKDLDIPEDRLDLLYKEAAKLGSAVTRAIHATTPVVTGKAFIADYEDKTLGERTAIQMTGINAYGSTGAAGMADFFNKTDEGVMREILNELYNVSKYTETLWSWQSFFAQAWGGRVEQPWKVGADEIPQQELEVAQAVMMARNPSMALRFIDSDTRERMGWGKWGVDELNRGKYNKEIIIHINNMAEDWSGDQAVLDYVRKVLEENLGVGAVLP